MRNKNNPIAPIREYSQEVLTPESRYIDLIVDLNQLNYNLAVLDKFRLDLKSVTLCWKEFSQNANSQNNEVPVLHEDHY